ncbi:MAG: SGNH/GDSL hydrolase family protein [Candidatus Omnitrophota bacterium]
MKKIIYGIALALFLLILADRIMKFCEESQRPANARKGRPGTLLTGKEMAEYEDAQKFCLYPYTVFGLPANYHSDTVNLNSIGLRGPEVGEKKAGAYRIAVLGGSAVFGAETTNDNLTFCKLLESDLKSATGRDVEVINAGLPAYVSMQELVLFEDKIIGLKPDLVIVFDGFNDVFTSLKRDKRPNYPRWFAEIETVYYTSMPKLFVEMKLKRYRPTKRIFRWLERRKAKLSEDFTVNPEQISFYGRNLDLICHLAKSYGIDAVLVFQPLLYYKTPLTENERAIIGRLDKKYVLSVVEMCNMAREAMRKTAEANSVPYIDGTGIFDGLNDDIFLDECHFNQAGHKMIADTLSAALKEGLKE